MAPHARGVVQPEALLAKCAVFPVMISALLVMPSRSAGGTAREDDAAGNHIIRRRLLLYYLKKKEPKQYTLWRNRPKLFHPIEL